MNESLSRKSLLMPLFKAPALILSAVTLCLVIVLVWQAEWITVHRFAVYCLSAPFLVACFFFSVATARRWRDLSALLLSVLLLLILVQQGLTVLIRAGWMIQETPRAMLLVDAVALAMFPLGFATVVHMRRLFQSRAQVVETRNALRESEERYRHLVENATDAVYEADAGGRFTFANVGASQLFKQTVRALEGMCFFDFMAPEEAGDLLAALERQRRGKVSSFYHEFPITRKDGTVRWVGQNVRGITEGGELKGFHAVVRDITDRRHAEEELRTNETRLRTLLETMSEGVIQAGPDGRFVYANPAAERILGLRPGEIERRHYLDSEWRFLGPDGSPLAADAWACAKAVAEKRLVQNAITGVRRPDGGISWISANAVPIGGDAQDSQGVVMTFADVGESRETAETLRFIEFAVDHAGEQVFLIGRHGGIIYANFSACEQLGYTKNELLSMHMPDVDVSLTRDRWETFWARAKTDGWPPHESRFVRKDGSKFPTMVTGNHLEMSGTEYIFAFARDITHESELQSQLRQAQKMEAIGTLAGGIAHDFNNILVSVLIYSELAMGDVPKDSQTYSHLKEVYNAGQRAAELIKQILTFSRRTEQERHPLRLAPVIKEALKLLKGTLPATIEIRADVDGNCGTVLADPSQVHQVIMNLSTNAYHAMRETGGVLDVSLKEATVSEAEAAERAGLSAGRHVVLRVMDTGHGITPEVMDRMFEPFFTTKGAGEGTGLGLATVHGIVKSHKGALKVDSEVGKGTTFTIWFPVTVQEGEPVAGDPEDVELPRGHERILLVDDEAAVAKGCSLAIERLGYRVTTCTQSREALLLFEANPSDFDLVITDQTMPQMTGVELAQRVLTLRPEIPIIICSGFSESVGRQSAESMGIREYLKKPLDARRLAVAIRRALGGVRAA